jgi:phosphotransferase system HPr-like phosphotransfer protein
LNSILALISLGLSCGTQVVVRVEGGDEENGLKRIGDLFEYEFDFPEK